MFLYIVGKEGILMRYGLRNAIYAKATLAAVSLALAGCTAQSNAPKQINGHTVYGIPFERPLLLKPNIGQEFYFYLTDEQQQAYSDYMVGITALIPDDDKKLMKEQDTWTYTDENNQPKKSNLQFDVKIEYIVKDKTVPVILTKTFWKDSGKKHTGWQRLWLTPYAHSHRKGGGNIIAFRKDLVRFVPRNLKIENEGFYKVSIRPSWGIQYPDVDFEIFVEEYYRGK
jgi:hypothetical protein